LKAVAVPSFTKLLELFPIVSHAEQPHLMHLKFHPNIQAYLMDPYMETFLPICVLIKLQ
jgi:hypothetical protein